MKSAVIVKNVFRRIRQDPRTLVMIVLTPLFFILLYGVTFSGSPQHLTLAVVDADNGLASVRTQEVGRVTVALNLAEAFVGGLNTQVFDVVHPVDGPAAEALVQAGRAWAALVFPENFSHALVNEAVRQSGPRQFTFDGRTLTVLPPDQPQPAAARLTVDNSNPTISAVVLQTLNEAFTRLMSQQQAPAAPADLLDLRLLYGSEVRPIDFTAPGVIGFAITLITIMLTAISIVRERTSGTLTRVLTAPVRPWEAVLGYTLAYTLVALFQVAELLLASHALFGVRFAGDVGWVALIVVVYTVGLQGVATLLSTLARNEFQAVQFILLVLIPSIMLSGVFWPLQAMPPGLQWVAWLSPLTYANAALRDVMLRGWGGAEIAPAVGVLAGFALVMVALSVWSMRRQAVAA